MATLFVVLLSFSIFRFTENRWCSGVNGLQCCNGYTLHKSTWSCEKCPTGYYGNCLTPCIPPSFGEECQSVCNCAEGFYCHFIYGCSQHKRNETKTQKSSSTSRIEISESLTKHITTTVNHLSKDDGFFKNNYVFLIIIVLIGVFVLSFAFFVATYTYFKCFRQKANSSEARENEWQAHYKSLDFEAMIAEPTFHQMSLEQRERLITDSAYLSPVFAGNESHIDSQGIRENETRPVNNEILREFPSKRQQTGHQAINSGENTVTIPTFDQSEHVYIEITEDEVESTNLTALDIYKDKNTKISAVLNRESAYVNENN